MHLWKHKTNKQNRNKYMAGINFDATTVTPNAGFAPVEKGKYTVIITKSEFKPTSNGAGKLINFHTTIQGGHNHGREIMFNLNWENQNAKAVEIGRGQFSAICHAVNVLRVQDTQQLHNIPFSLEVDVTADGKYNEVKGIFPVSPMEQPQPQAMPQAQPQFVQPQAPVQQPAWQQPQPQPQFVQPQAMPQPQPQAGDIPPWIAAQMAAQQSQAPMGNV
jgi:hypothetical protein